MGDWSPSCRATAQDSAPAHRKGSGTVRGAGAALYWHCGRTAFALSSAEEEGQDPFMPMTVTKWPEHSPWQYVTPQALNSRGEQIFYCVESDQYRMIRMWAWRLERAVDHRAVRERDLGKLSDMHARDPRDSKTGGFFAGGRSASMRAMQGSLLGTRPFITGGAKALKV